MSRYLFVAPARLGDAVMSTPAVAVLAAAGHRVTVLAVSALGASVFEHNPHIHQLLLTEAIDDWQALAAEHDATVVSHYDARTAKAAENLSLPSYILPAFERMQPQSAQAVAFVMDQVLQMPLSAPVHEYALYPSQADHDHVRGLLESAAVVIGKTPLIGFHLGCHGIARKKRWRRFFRKRTHPKVWPLKHFIALAKLLAQHDPNVRIVVTGSPNEAHLASQFCRRVKSAIHLCGQTNTLQLAALMTCFQGYVSGDTGAMHVACAMQTPLVALFGQTNAQVTGPYPPTPFRHVLQADPIAAISPKQVLAGLLNLRYQGHFVKV